MQLTYSSIIGLIVVAAIIGAIYYFQKKQKDGKPMFSGTPILDQYTNDLTLEAENGQLDPVIGREEEIKRLIQILSRRTKNNALIIGKAGTGKTALAEGLALKIIKGEEVPLGLSGDRVLELDVTEVLSGTKYRGEFEERAKKILNEITEAKRRIVLFIDEIHMIVQSQGAEGSVNFTDILKPALARGKLQLIGATTKEEYEQYIKPQSSLERRFQVIEVHEPSKKETIQILKGVQKKYMSYHNVEFTPAALKAAVLLSEKYVKNRNLPDKAIDVIDEAAAMAKVSHLDKMIVGILHGAAKDKDPAFAEKWKKIRVLDKQVLQTTINSPQYKKLSIQRDKLQEEFATKLGKIIVDVADVRSVIATWLGKKPEQIDLPHK